MKPEELLRRLNDLALGVGYWKNSRRNAYNALFRHLSKLVEKGKKK